MTELKYIPVSDNKEASGIFLEDLHAQAYCMKMYRQPTMHLAFFFILYFIPGGSWAVTNVWRDGA